MLLKAYRRHKARRAVVEAAEGVAASFEPGLDLKFDPDDLAALQRAVTALDRAALVPYRLRWERYVGKRQLRWVKGDAPQWPWWELALPRWGSLILARKTPRSI